VAEAGAEATRYQVTGDGEAEFLWCRVVVMHDTPVSSSGLT
jgi:hypothetical protein